jgi:uncharacterized membrane protein
MKILRKILWVIIVLLAILVGLIPLSYIEPDINSGFLELKDRALLQNIGWQIGFNAHIISGGIAIVIGWMQFSKGLLKKRPVWHRTIGKVYVVAGLTCGLSGVYIGYYATGGPVAATGFMTIGVIYFYTTLKGYLYIRNKQIAQHQAMMLYSYAACLAAVTLRLYVPFLTALTGDYFVAYRMVAWLSWIPNLMVANALIARKSVEVSV